MPKKVTRVRTDFIIRIWDVDGFPNYFFGKDKNLYRFDSGGQIKQNKRIVISTIQGYVIKRKSDSLSQFRTMLRWHDLTDHPMDF